MPVQQLATQNPDFSLLGKDVIAIVMGHLSEERDRIRLGHTCRLFRSVYVEHFSDSVFLSANYIRTLQRYPKEVSADLKRLGKPLFLNKIDPARYLEFCVDLSRNYAERRMLSQQLSQKYSSKTNFILTLCDSVPSLIIVSLLIASGVDKVFVGLALLSEALKFAMGDHLVNDAYDAWRNYSLRRNSPWVRSELYRRVDKGAQPSSAGKEEAHGDDAAKASKKIR